MANETGRWFGPFHLDLGNQMLRRGEIILALTPKAFSLLEYLAARPGQLVTKEELFSTLWPETVVSEAALTVVISEVRQRLGDEARAPRYIETVHRRGYRFIGKVVSHQEENQKSKITSPAPPLSTQHPAPPLVGRDSELTHLRHLFEQAIDGERQLVFFTGEPGIGKTALIENFLKGTRLWELGSRSSSPHPLEPSSQLPNPGCWVAWGQCIEQFGEGEAYLPLLSAISQCCKVPGNESIIPELQQHAPTWLVQLPALVGHEEFERLQRKTAGATRTRMLRELAEALEVLTQQQPLILVLEDLHWSDPSTLEFLAFLARQRQPAKLLVLGTYRPVEMLADGHPLKRTLQELFAHHLATELALRLLTEADISTYLHRRFPAQQFSL